VKKNIAFFDFDGTICAKDSFLDFILFCCGKFRMAVGLFYLSPFVVAYLLKLYPNYKLKEHFFKHFLADYLPFELEKKGEIYAETRLTAFIYEDAMAKILWHKNNHHRVIIITASSSIWLSAWCKKHHLELISTQFEIIEGKYSEKILGKNCEGLEKLAIVKKILAEEKDAISYGYGNTKADLPFLNALQHKHYKAFGKKG